VSDMFTIRVLSERNESEAVLDRLDQWFDLDRPDGFVDCKVLNSVVHIDGEDRCWACVTFPAADEDMAQFMKSLAIQECGMAGSTVELIAS
jgi:hypothetical protein